MVTAMYYVGGPDDSADPRSELRYSIRSVATNAPFIDEVYVVGDVPDWFAGVKVPLEPRSEKFANARQSITRFVNLPAAPETFVLLMDDVFVTEPTTAIDVIHLGTARNYSAYKTGKGTYATAIRNTTDWLHAHSHPDPLAYLGHTPVPLNTAKVRDFLSTYPDHLLLEPFMLYCVAGTQGPGRRAGNAKCARADNLKHKLALDIPYLSSNPDTWPGELGQHIKGMFSVACRWER